MWNRSLRNVCQTRIKLDTVFVFKLQKIYKIKNIKYVNKHKIKWEWVRKKIAYCLHNTQAYNQKRNNKNNSQTQNNNCLPQKVS